MVQMQTVRIQAKGIRRIMRRSLTKQLVRKFDALVSRAENLIDDEDRNIETAIYWFLVFAAIYLIAQVVRVLWQTS